MRLARLLAPAGIALLCATAAQAQTGAAASSPAEATGNWDAIVSCARFERAEQRHACTDDVMRAAGLLSRERELAEQRETFGQSPRGQKAEEEETYVPTSAPQPPAEIESVESTIAYARKARSGKLLIVTDEGAVWRQTSSETFRDVPQPGTAFSAQKAAMGSFKCKTGRYSVFRCERLD